MLQNHREKRKRQPVRKTFFFFLIILICCTIFGTLFIPIMFNIFRTTQIWWPPISTLEIYFLEQILAGKGLYVSIKDFRVCVEIMTSTFCCWVHGVLLQSAICDLTLPKKKLKDERRKKKIRTIKVETEDCEALAPSDSLAPPANIMNSLPDTPSTPLPNIKEEWV